MQRMEELMKDSVVIKGSKSGIIVVLDKDIDFDTLKKDVEKKFKDAADFWGEGNKAISFQGRQLTDDEKVEIIDIIQSNCKLSIVCIVEDDPEVETAFARSIEQKLTAQDINTGQFFKGNLRSGQVLDVETSIIIIGDVKAGAKVISKGNVIILGALRGNVYAGAAGNTNSFVVALDMNPVQIRIADIIARAPDKPNKEQKKETKIAFVEDGNIYIETLDKDVMNDIHL